MQLQDARVCMCRRCRQLQFSPDADGDVPSPAAQWFPFISSVLGTPAGVSICCARGLFPVQLW